MNNLLSYCGLVDAKIRASDNDLPVQYMKKKKLPRMASPSIVSILAIRMVIGLRVVFVRKTFVTILTTGQAKNY